MECPVCFETREYIYTGSCGHVICLNCINNLPNKKECYNMDVITRNEEMDDISERMTSIIEDINLYKECINAEKKEMKKKIICSNFLQHFYESKNSSCYRIQSRFGQGHGHRIG